MANDVKRLKRDLVKLGRRAPQFLVHDLFARPFPNRSDYLVWAGRSDFAAIGDFLRSVSRAPVSM